jgi:ABC-type transport system involved in multi-copper enzyme maturation permease subunit
MRINQELLIGLKPIYNTITFEIKKQRKKFYAFLALIIIISVAIVVITGFIRPDTLVGFFFIALAFIIFLLDIAACLFFSAIICSEFDKKTGYIVFPKINKYKLILGKYLGNLILCITLITSYYIIIGVLGLFYYGGETSIRLFYSYLIALLYLSTLSSFVTFFSSFLKSVNGTIVITFVLLLFGFMIIDQLVGLIFAEKFEPLYSLAFLGNLIVNILVFPDLRYINVPFDVADPTGPSMVQWITPSIGVGITMMLLFTVLYLVLAALLFKRRQL